jgi:hypothetical protein
MIIDSSYVETARSALALDVLPRAHGEQHPHVSTHFDLSINCLHGTTEITLLLLYFLQFPVSLIDETHLQLAGTS